MKEKILCSGVFFICLLVCWGALPSNGLKELSEMVVVLFSLIC